MKTTINTSKTVFTAIAIIGLSFVTACKKGNITPTSNMLTESDAVELTTDALVPANGGLVVQVNSAANVSKTVTLGCGVEKDSTITKSSVNGVTPSYNYALTWAYVLNCSTNQLTFNFNGNSAYSGVNMTSTDKSTGTFVLSGILPTAGTYVFNASYTRSGTTTSKIGRNYSFNSNLVIQSANLTVDKTTLQILTGTATVSITGTSTSGSSVSFNGSITFLGGNKATLVLNSGTPYTIQWS